MRICVDLWREIFLLSLLGGLENWRLGGISSSFEFEFEGRGSGFGVLGWGSWITVRKGSCG